MYIYIGSLVHTCNSLRSVIPNYHISCDLLLNLVRFVVWSWMFSSWNESKLLQNATATKFDASTNSCYGKPCLWNFCSNAYLKLFSCIIGSVHWNSRPLVQKRSKSCYITNSVENLKKLRVFSMYIMFTCYILLQRCAIINQLFDPKNGLYEILPPWRIFVTNVKYNNWRSSVIAGNGDLRN